MTKKQKKTLTRIIISFVLVGVIFFIPVKSGIIKGLLYLIPYIIIGYEILIKAVKGIIKGQVLDENFLMAVASVGAFIIGFLVTFDFLEGVAVLLFYQVGEFFQGVAVRKSRKEIASLMDIRPNYANLIKEDGIKKVSPEEVEIGSVIVVKAGEKIPIDGIIVDGYSTLNTLAMTGESDYKDVKVGDEVISGTINVNGIIKVKTTKAFSQSTVSKVIELVENASSKKAKAEKFISKFAYVYTPIVCALALAISIIPPVFNLIFNLEPNFFGWIYRGLSFLVISCPCALVISIPLSFFACIGGLSSNGILVKGSNYIEALSKIETVVFDKTGTLTIGNNKVVKIESLIYPIEDFIYYVAIIEGQSTHPIAKSVVSACSKPLDFNLVCDYIEQSGLGITARVLDKKIAVGNQNLMEKVGIELPIIDEVGKIIYVCIDKEFAGYLVVTDVIKENASLTIEKLKKLGVKKVVMLTGDNQKNSSAVAKKLNISTFYHSLLPNQKVEKIESLIKNSIGNKTTCFVGDGINDSPVLKMADVGISMGSIGSDSAIESSDVVIVDDNLEKIATAIATSKKCMGIVKQNIVFSLFVKGLCLLLSGLGLVGLWFAIIADVGVMLLAIINSVRTIKIKRG